MHLDDKASYRRQLRAARLSLSHRAEAGLAIQKRIRNLDEWAASACVLLYIDVRGEVPTRALLAEELKLGQRRVALPWCLGDELRAVHVKSMDELVPGRFGIPEPDVAIRDDPERQLAAADFDLMIIPGVGFDRLGQRLGSGRGYYDRFLLDAGSRPRLCGVAFDCQLVDCVPTEPHDRPMHLIVTETQLLRAS